MLQNVSIRSKLLVSFLLITLFTVLAGFYSSTGIKKNDEVFQKVLEVTTSLQALLEMKSVAYSIDRETISFRNLSNVSTQSETSAAASQKFKILATLEQLDRWQKEYEEHVDITNPSTKSFIRTIEEAKASITAATLDYVKAKEEGSSVTEVTRFESELVKRIEKLKKDIEAAVIEAQKDLVAAEAVARKESRLVTGINIAISLLTVLAALFLTALLTRLIDRPLRKVRDAALLVAKGDLSTRVDLHGRDEIGELAGVLNQMTQNLEKAQTGLKEKAEETEQKARALEEQVRETEKTKKAVINLLEDTQEAEKREADQAAKLKKALEKVNEFAHVADQERNMYLLLLASIGEGVLVLDTERKVTIVNRVAEKTLGYKSSEMVGKNFAELIKFIHADKKPLDEHFWDEVFASTFSMTPANDLSIIGKTGEIVPIFIIVAPIIDATNRESKGVIITFRDVREERALEEARIGFISTASHQLRTPLTSMRWFSEMLLGGDAGEINEDQKHFVERIYQGTDRMIALVNLLLQLARVEAGRVKVDPVPIDLKATTEGVILATKVNFDNKTQTIDIKTKPIPLPVIPMDQDMLWQVIQNLLSNANRYSPVGSTIFVEIVEQEKEIEYTVRDTGIGVPKDQQARLFEKFFRADNAVSSVPEGSGLGLSLVKILVEGWGGRIWFESKENKGTTFHFTIPLEGMKPKEGEVKLTV